MTLGRDGEVEEDEGECRISSKISHVGMRSSAYSTRLAAGIHQSKEKLNVQDVPH